MTYKFEFWLTLEPPNGSRFQPPAPRVTKGQPSLKGQERSMKLMLEVPKKVFETPSLSATVRIAEPNVDTVHVDTEAASEALKQAIGCDVYLSVVEEGQGE